MSIEDEEFANFDEDHDETKHEKLINNVLNLNKAQQVKKSSRSEPTLRISEFDLVKSLTGKKGSVNLNELTNILKNKKGHAKIKKNLKNTTKISKTLPTPLEKPLADQIKRTVAYEKARLELDEWEPIVTSNRVSTDLFFPLSSPKIEEVEQASSGWRVKSKFDLEWEKQHPVEVEEIHVDTEKEKFPMTMKEIMEHRKESAKLRAHQSYKEAKARRQNKIKSKKYHRIGKKEKIKQQLKDFELLQKTNPEKALKKLEEIEKIRAHERFSLRHKSTGKWAKNKQIRAKYDKESRQELAEQLTISKELTQKVNAESDSDEEVLPQEENIKMNSTEKDNPWLNGMKADKEVSDFVNSYKKYWSEKNSQPENKVDESIQNQTEAEVTLNTDSIIDKKHSKDKTVSDKSLKNVSNINTSKKQLKKKSKVKTKKVKQNLKDSLSTSEWDVETTHNDHIDAIFDKMEKKIENKLKKKIKKLQVELVGKKSKKKSKKRNNDINKNKESLLTLPIRKKRPIVDESLSESINDTDQVNDDELSNLTNILEKKDNPVEKKSIEPNVDPNKFMSVKPTHLNGEIPDVTTNMDEDDEDIEENSTQHQLIAEAFQDDNLLEEFTKEKSDIIEKDKPKDVNLTLPGWGSWGGTGIVPSKRKERRFIFKTPKKLPRRDDNKGFLIINEDASKKVKEHMVDELPFPFQRVKDFEASIRAPIGRTFVPETAFQRLTKPALKTRIGAIIEPMDKEVLLKKPVL